MPRSGRFSGRIIAGTVFLFVAAVGLLYHRRWTLPPPSFSSPPGLKIKVMIVGDSISQGTEGDFTWRYRLWEWFQSQKIAVKFVGPYNGTVPPQGRPPPSSIPLDDNLRATDVSKSQWGTWGGYAPSADTLFLQENGGAHFALWGRSAFQVRETIAQQVKTYMPDLMLVELGFNDLGWFWGPEDTVQSMETLIRNAREVNPRLKFAASNVPYRTAIDGRDDLPVMTDHYNDLLEKALPGWGTEESPVELVHFREDYTCYLDDCPAGHDGLHPNALGEYQMARAFTQTLHNKFGMGKAPLEIPDDIPPRICSTPPNVQASQASNGINVTWDAVYGTYRYEMQAKLPDTIEWSEGFLPTYLSYYESTWPSTGESWEFRVRSSCGDALKSDWSGVVSAVAATSSQNTDEE